MEGAKTLFFKRSNFVTHLPVHYRYTNSHFWAETLENGVLRIGFTKFATRMLGEAVDHGFDKAASEAVAPGDVIGWVEGFKAISDIIAVGQGEFAGSNPKLKETIELLTESNYKEGWLYELKGTLDEERALDVHGYAEHLSQTIDRILQAQGGEQGES